MFEASVKRTDPMTVAYLEMSGDYGKIPDGFTRLYTWVQEYDHTPQGMPAAVYLTDPSAEQPRWELWAPIEGGAIQFGPDERALGVKQVEPAEVASAMHRGSYENLGETYRQLEQWVTEHGYEICGAPREYYYNGPEEASPEELTTEIQFPVRKH